MRLLAVSSWLPYPPDNGSRVRAYQLLRHLARRHRVTLLTFGVQQSPGSLGELDALCDAIEVVPPMPWVRRAGVLPFLSSAPRHLVQTDSPRMRALVAAHLPRHEAAIAFELDAARYLVGWPAIPRIFEEVEVGVYRDAWVAERTSLRRWRRWLTWWKFMRYVRGLVNSYTRSTVVSAKEYGYLVAAGCEGDRIVTVANGAVVADALPPRNTVGRQLIYPGAVTYSANLDAVRRFVHQIFPLVRQVCPDATFVVTGATDGVDVSDLAGAPGVSFTGRLPEVDSLITRSAVCVVPLRIGGGTRLKILQSMALGTPVVSTPKGAEGLDAEPGRDLLVGDSNEDFAASVVRLLTGDPAVAAALSRQAHALVRARHSWDAIGRQLEGVVDDAVARRALPRDGGGAGP